VRRDGEGVPRPVEVGVLASRVRFEEVMIFEALERRGVGYAHVDDRALALPASGGSWPFPVALNRSISHWRGLYAALLLEAGGVEVVNPSRVSAVCGDKAVSSTVLERAGVPVPRTTVALTPAAALRAIEDLGYPVVLKPVVGSWGRLVARVNDRDAAEALLESRAVMGPAQQRVVYVQEYVDAGGRDLRVIVVGDDVVGAVRRRARGWIANVARGAASEPVDPSPELERLAMAAAAAVGGGALAVDVLESRDGRLLVAEVNSTMEFRGFAEATGIDVADRLVALALARRARVAEVAAT
jgi:[lysine-biosynthesis-protein LysW]---L-2-aminoadipate ligase